MRIDLMGKDAPRNAISLPFRLDDSGADALQLAVITLAQAGPYYDRLLAIAEQIAWKSPKGRNFPHGHLVVNDTDVSRQQRARLFDALGGHAPAVVSPEPAELASAWERFLIGYREHASRLAADAVAARQRALDEAAAERERYGREMGEWIRTHGSSRLLHAFNAGQRVHRMYRDERRNRDYPGLMIDPDSKIPVAEMRETPAHATAALEAVAEFISETKFREEPLTPELVYVSSSEIPGYYGDEGGMPAVRLTGWLGRHTLLGFCPSDHQIHPEFSIDGRYPDSAHVRTDSQLRPTAYASAVGVAHPAAQDALKSAAEVVIDEFGDFEPEEKLPEILPRDAADLINDELIRNITDTLFLVGWKLGQPRLLLPSCLAEVIAYRLIVEAAYAQLDMAAELGALSDEGFREAKSELDVLDESVLDDQMLEYIEMPDAYELADVVPAVLKPRWLSLWAPFDASAGDPPPRITGSDEPTWHDPDAMGLTARQAVNRDRHLNQTARDARLEILATGRWRLEDDDGRAVLLCESKAGCDVLFPPHALAGPGRVEDLWTLLRWPSVEAFRADENHDTSENAAVYRLGWHEVFSRLPSGRHALAVDAVVATIDRALQWQLAVTTHAIAAGPIEPIEQAAQALAGAAALRKDLEGAREAGVVRDRRLTRFGIRHEHFGDYDAARFAATVRFRRSEEETADTLLATFHESVFDFSPMPVALSVDIDPDDPDQVILTCGMAVHTIEEAFVLANEVIGQTRWRLGLEPISLPDEEGPDGSDEDEGEGIAYRIEEVNRRNNSGEATEE